MWGGGLVTIVHKCVNSANIHSNCDNQHNQVIVSRAHIVAIIWWKSVTAKYLQCSNDNIYPAMDRYYQLYLLSSCIDLAWRHLIVLAPAQLTIYWFWKAGKLSTTTLHCLSLLWGRWIWTIDNNKPGNSHGSLSSWSLHSIDAFLFIP